MVRVGIYALVGMMLLGNSVWAETIPLTRVYNGDEQMVYDWNHAITAGGFESNGDDDQDDYSAGIASRVESVFGFTIGYALDVSTATCNTAVTTASMNPSVGAVTGGPMIITNSSNGAFVDSYGEAYSDADFVIGNPTDPNAVLVMTGTITIIASPGAQTGDFSTTVSAGGSSITCTPSGCTGIIKDVNAPGGQYTVSSSSLGGSWNVSQYVTKGTTLHMGAGASYFQTADVDCSEYPDFNVAAFMSVNTLP